MTAIATTSTSGPYTALRTGAVAATTDWIAVPRWATHVIFHLDISVAGTNTIPVIKSAFLGTLDDTRVATLLTGATITAATYHSYSFGPGLTTVADSATVSTNVATATGLPSLIGLTVTPTGSTYSTAVEFRQGLI